MKTKSCMIMSVPFTHFTKVGVVGEVAEYIASNTSRRPLAVFTPNVEQLVQSQTDKAFLKNLLAADVRIPDSVGLVWADWWRAAVTGTHWFLRERIAGVDIAENLLAEAAMHGWKVVIIGGFSDTSAKAVKNLKKRFHGLQVWSIPVGDCNDAEDQPLDKINQLAPDLLFVGFGAPKQERWVIEYRDQLTAKVIMVVGGAVDMWAGNVKRAPLWCQKIGFEWLYRLAQEPWRAKRQTRLLQFAAAVIRGKW